MTKEGSIIWQKTFDNFSFRSLTEDLDGNYIIAGSKKTLEQFDVTKLEILAFIKLDTNGLLMAETVLDDFGSILNIILDEEQNLYIGGYLNVQNYYEGFITKINKYEIIEWKFQSNLQKLTFFQKFSIFEDNIYIAGKSNNDFLFFKLNQNGNLVFNEIFGGTSEDYFQDILIFEDELYLIGGSKSTDFFVNKTTDDHDAIVIKFNQEGIMLDYEIFNNTPSVEIINGAEVINDNLIIFGYSNGKTDHEFNFESEKNDAFFRIVNFELIENIIITFEDGENKYYSIYNDSQNYLIPELTNTSGRIFVGWFYDLEYSEIYHKEDVLTENITLYAKWLIFLEPIQLFNGELPGLDTIDFELLDFDNDGDIDILIAIAQGNYTNVNLLRNNDFQFTEEILITEEYIGGDLVTLDVINWDNDDDIEMILSISNNNYHNIIKYDLENDVYVSEILYDGFYSGTYNYESIIFDIDQNGYQDYIIVISGNNYFTIQTFFN